MFTQSVPAPPPAPVSTALHVASSSSSPASPTARTSRLRGLSYLRSYTQNHLLNREHGGGPGASSPPNSAPISEAAVSASGTGTGAGTGARFVEGFGTLTAPPAGYRLSLVSSHDGISASSAHSAHSAAQSSDPSDRSDLSIAAPAGPLSLSGVAASLPLSATAPVLSPLNMSATGTAVVAPAAPAAPSDPLVSAAPGNMTQSLSAVDAASASASATPAGPPPDMENLPSIRFTTFYDTRSSRPSLKFPPMSRTLPTGKEVIRVGRYSERDSQPNPNPNMPSAAHVGFKSKVVSRRHCEFWYENNRWYIKDVKSSSGTFLNHIRLSLPGIESKPFAVSDGDLVQLGIDFKGGEEMIFRCVKMRVELNRGWQSKLNAFNLNTHKRLRNMTKAGEGSGSVQSSQDCSICLNSIAPCQSLFVAPCSHTWHYKCIRSLLELPQYPSFICPNCRAAVDLEADVEDPPEEWEGMDLEEGHEEDSHHPHQDGAVAGPSGEAHSARASQPMSAAVPPPASTAAAGPAPVPAEAPASAIGEDGMAIDFPEPEPEQQRPAMPTFSESHATSSLVPIPVTANAGARFAGASALPPNGARQVRTPSPSNGTHQAVLPSGHEGPITPRNDAGPWVFDGSDMHISTGASGTAGTTTAAGLGPSSAERRLGEMCSLDTAADELAGQFSH